MDQYTKAGVKGLIFYVAYHLWMEGRWRAAKPIYWWMRHIVLCIVGGLFLLGIGIEVAAVWSEDGLSAVGADWSNWGGSPAVGVIFWSIVGVIGLWRYRVADLRWRGVYAPPLEPVTVGRVGESTHLGPSNPATYDDDRLQGPSSAFPHPGYRLPPRYRRVGPREVEFECFICHNPGSLVKFVYEQDEWGWFTHATHDLCGSDEYAREDDEPFSGY
jgi:hypothetical protein